MSSNEAFARLGELARRGESNDADLPAQRQARQEWTGVGFRLGGRHFVAAMGEVTEILSYPELSRIPHARQWVRGIANVRGNLLPIMDLNAYLGRGRITLNRLSRVLVMEREGVVAGLLVDEVLGMRRFYAEQWGEDDAEDDPELQPYIAGAFRREEGRWPLFSMERLARHPQFLKVAE